MTIMRRSLIMLVLVVMPFLSCGKKGPLVLEPVAIPNPVENIQLFQVGNILKLEWDFPQVLAGKEKNPMEIEKIGRIFIYHSDKEITGGKFKKRSTLLKKLKIEDLNTAPSSFSTSTASVAPSGTSGTSGQEPMKRLTYSIHLPFTLKQLVDKVHYFGIQYEYGKKKSPLSTIVFIRTLAPVKPVTDLKVTRENKVIKLTWSRALQDEAGNTISTIAGYSVYRKIVPEKVADSQGGTESEAPVKRVFKKLNQDNVLSEYYEDSDTGTNGNYSYYVSAVISNQVESAPSQEVTVQVTDVFPPEVPGNLVCFKASDHMFLTWKPSGDGDFSHYRVYRHSLAEKEFQLIADDITSTTYKDSDIKTGVTYFYVVTSVDLKGNESEYSNEVKEQF